LFLADGDIQKFASVSLADGVGLLLVSRQPVVACLCASQADGGGGMGAAHSGLIAAGDGNIDLIVADLVAYRGSYSLAVFPFAVCNISPIEDHFLGIQRPGSAGGRTAHGDAGGVLARVGGERAVFQHRWTILARLYVADGDPTRRRTLPIAACSHRGGFAFPAVCQLGGGLDGHAAAACAALAALGSDGRAVCRILPLMRMHLQLYGLAVIHQANIIRGVIAGEILCNNPARIRRRSDIHIPLRKISSRSHADFRVRDQLPADRDLFAAGQADIVCDTASLVVALNNSIATNRHRSG